MSRDDIVERIRACRSELDRIGVGSIALFGSAARNEARADSDVDVLIDFNGPATFDRYMDAKELLERVLARRVDLVTRSALKPRLIPHIERDLLHVA